MSAFTAKSEIIAFIVNRAASPDFAVNEFTGICRVNPAVAFRNYVEMPDYAHDFVAFADFGISAISVEIFCFETEFVGNRKHVFKAFFVAFSERTAVNGRVENGLYSHRILDGFHHLRQIFFNIHRKTPCLCVDKIIAPQMKTINAFTAEMQKYIILFVRA